MGDRIADFLFLFSIIAVGIVIFWSVKQDKLGDNAKTSGLLAMKHPDEPDEIA